MAFDSEMSASVGAHSHDHSHDRGHGHAPGLPHSHGAAALRAVATTPEIGTLANPPAMSLLRLSIQARLVSAVVFAALIWAAIHWATS